MPCPTKSKTGLALRIKIGTFTQSKFFGDLTHLVRQHLIIKSFSLIAVSFAIRQLGPTGLGALGYAMAAISVGLMLASLGLDQLLPKTMADKVTEEEREIVGLRAYSMRLFVIFCLAPLFCLGALFQISQNVTTGAIGWFDVVAIWGAAYLFLIGTALNPEAYQQGKDAVKNLGDFQLKSAIVSSALFLLIFRFFPSPPAFILIQAIAVLQIAWHAFLPIRNLKKLLPHSRTFAHIKAHLKSSSTTITNVFVIWCFISLDVFFLPIFANPEQVGFYAAASTLSNGVNVFVALIPMAFYPRLLSWAKMSLLLAVSRTIIIAAGVLLSAPVFYLTARFICGYGVPLILGQQYRDSSDVLAALISQFYIYVGYYSITFLFVAVEKFRYALAVSLVGALLSAIVYPLAAYSGGAIFLAHGKLFVCWIMVATGLGLMLSFKKQIVSKRGIS